jgi:hypothetical protein
VSLRSLLGRDVAIKVWAERFSERFEREAPEWRLEFIQRSDGFGGGSVAPIDRRREQLSDRL